METKELNPQFIKGPDGKPIGVFLTIQEWNKIIEDLDELVDIEAVYAYDKKLDKELIPYDQAMEEIGKERDELHP